MALAPKDSIMAGLAVGAIVYTIHSQATPTMSDIRVGAPNDETIAKNERAASWISASVVAGISLIAKDPTIFILGGAMVVGMAWWTRFNNAVNPVSQTPSMEGAQVQDIQGTEIQNEADIFSIA